MGELGLKLQNHRGTKNSLVGVSFNSGLDSVSDCPKRRSFPNRKSETEF